jgi:hypothetical protein
VYVKGDESCGIEIQLIPLFVVLNIVPEYPAAHPVWELINTIELISTAVSANGYICQFSPEFVVLSINPFGQPLANDAIAQPVDEFRKNRSRIPESVPEFCCSHTAPPFVV